MGGFERKVEHFDLDKIAASGQVFRWRRTENGSWHVPAAGKQAILMQDGDGLSVECADGDEKLWHRYLALDEDYDRVFEKLGGKSAEQDQALAFSDGIRILRQPFFETCISFLFSQNNNIKNISGSIERLCGGEDEPFPSADEIVSRLQKDPCGAGYRLGYLMTFCRAYAWGKLERLEKISDGEEPPLPYSQVIDKLTTYKGIGPKVAACIALFSMGYRQAVPRDVWIRRLEERYDVEWDDELAGVQQQFLFYAIRNGAI